MTNTTCTASAPAALTVGSLVTLNGDTYRVESIDRPAAVAAELERIVTGLIRELGSRARAPGNALTLAERAVFMEKGAVRFEGPTRDLLERPDILRAVFLDGADAATPATPNGSGAGVDLTFDPSTPPPFAGPATAPAHAAPLAATSVTPTVPTGPLVRTGPVLECHGVTKRFGGVTAVDNVDLTVHPGTILGLVGQNGAGNNWAKGIV